MGRKGQARDGQVSPLRPRMMRSGVWNRLDVVIRVRSWRYTRHCTAEAFGIGSIGLPFLAFDGAPISCSGQRELPSTSMDASGMVALPTGLGRRPTRHGGARRSRRTNNGDLDTDRRLLKTGWTSLRVWEHEDPEVAATIIEQVVKARLSPTNTRTAVQRS